MKSCYVYYRYIKADCAIHNARPAWAAMAEVLGFVPEGMDALTIEDEITDAVMAAEKDGVLSWDDELLNLCFEDEQRPGITLYKRVIVKGLLTVVSGEVKVGEMVHGVGSPLAALMIAADFAQLFSLSQASQLRTDAIDARNKGLGVEAMTVEAALMLWMEAERVFADENWGLKGPSITHVKVSGYKASKFNARAGWDTRYVDAEVRFNVTRGDGKAASMVASVTMKRDRRDLFGVGEDRWKMASEWCCREALTTLGNNILVEMLAEAVDEAVDQSACRDVVA